MSIHTMLIPLLIIAPLFFATAGFVFQKKAKLVGLVFSVVFFLLNFLLFISTGQGLVEPYFFGGFKPPLGITFHTQPFGVLILFVSSFILLVTFFYAALDLKLSHSRLFYPLAIFLSLGFVIIYLSRDIFNIYIGLEIIGLSAVGLSALEKNFLSIRSALIYLFATLVASGFYLLGVAILYLKYSLLDITLLAQVIQSDFTTLVAIGFMILAFFIKTAIFPFSFWLPNAHANALSPVSAILSALVIKTTFYLLFTFSTKLIPLGESIGIFLTSIGIVAIFYGGIKAFLSQNLKRLIAYSTISQVGYLLVVFIFSTTSAFYGMSFALLSHAFAKAGLFLAGGIIIYMAQTKSLTKLNGAVSLAPVAVFAIGLSSVSLIGLPPSLGFVSKWYFLQTSFESGTWWIFLALIGGGLLSALYLFRLIIILLDKTSADGFSPRYYKNKNTLTLLQTLAFTLSFLSVFVAFFSTYFIKFLGPYYGF